MDKDYKKEWPDLDIKFLVLATDNYIVFIDSSLDVDWDTKSNYKVENERKFNDIINSAALLESNPCCISLKKDVVIRFKRLIGEAIARNLGNDYENAALMLKSAENFITSRSAELARMWYVISSGIFATIFIFLAFIGWIGRNYFIGLLGVSAFFLIITSLAGALGSFLSIIQRMGNTPLNSSSGQQLHVLEGASKIVAGVISAFLVVLSVNSGILLPIFTKADKQHIAMALAGLIAGASERLVPSLISHVESIAVDIQNK
jgi:hypothetical protein